MEDKIEVFILFNQEDRQLFLEFKQHLAPLVNEGLITIWDEYRILAGTNWRQAIDYHFQNASLVLFLVSAHFMASESYTLVRQALAKHSRLEGSVVPILLREVDWEYSDFGSLKPLPSSRKPISSWSDRHTAFFNVVRDLRPIIDKYKESIANASLVTITTPDGNKFTTNVPANMLVDRVLHIVLSQWLPLTLGTTGSRHFSLRSISFDRNGTLNEASLVAKTNLELVSEALGPNQPIKLRVEDDEGNVYTGSVLLNTVVSQMVHDFLGITPDTGKLVVEWMLSATSAKQLRLEASLYYQGVCDDALLRVYRIKTVVEE